MKSSFVLSLALWLLVSYSANGQQYCHTENNVGIGGYDPVAYHLKNEAVTGSSTHVASFDGINYYFESESNKKGFEEDPEKYLPAFGGWCSMTLAMGRATAPDFTNFLIDESGKLYLFERTLSVNGREIWIMDVPENKRQASENYSKHLKGEL
jgi:YHS domain-containing protein